MNYHLKIKQGNLVLAENVDFIVNASNTSLILGSGVSMAFFRHCGHQLQEQMDGMLSEIKATGYRLKKGDVVPTKSGEASNFKHALHAVTVDTEKSVYTHQARSDLADIEKALINIEKIIIEYAALFAKESVTLVLPLLGCGVGGLNKQEVIVLYRTFFSRLKGASTINCHCLIYAHNKDDLNILERLIV